MIADWLETALNHFEQKAVVSDLLRAGRAATDLLRAFDAHPADDAEPVTEEWLRSVGLGKGVTGETAKCIGDTCVNVIDRGEHGLRLTLGDGYYVVGVGLPHSTRGHVRRLCAALGIPLVEPK